MWEKFRQISQIIIERGINAALIGGDLFDVPNPPISIVNSYLQLFAYWNIPIYSIVGSHDKFGYNDDTLYRTGLGTLIAAGIIKLLDVTQRIGYNTQIAGVSHSYALDENPATDYYRKKLVANEYLIQICHGMITEVPWGFGKYTNVKDIKTEADLVISGHYHPGFKPVQVGNTTIINPGSLGRTENVQRCYSPGVVIVTTDVPGKESWELLPLNVPENVFGQKEVRTEEAFEDISTFIQLLKDRSSTNGYGNIKELIILVGQTGKYPENIIAKALEYIE
jgi:DNA repair exonuclease SbcCD nuclease subunit